MSVILRNSCNHLGRRNREFDTLLSQFFAPSSVFETSTRSAPSVDLAETENEVLVNAELPGLTEKDIEVTLDNGILSIKGEKTQAEEDKKVHFHHVERRYGAFHRQVKLPAAVDGNAVGAKFENGVLTITLPKSEEAKPKRIEVN